MKTPFFQLSQDELRDALVSAGFEKFRAKQVFDAVYKNKIFSPEQIPAIPKKIKEHLAENFEFEAGKLVGNKEACDETRKYLFALQDGKFVECVLLEAPSDDDGKIRKTL